MRRTPCNVLLVQPRFSPNSFWNYRETYEATGARYSAAPLGLVTVAALLPRDWPARLVDRNTEELRDEDLAWADLVMTGGMLPQQIDTRAVIALAHARGKKVVVGGPDPTFNPEMYAEADFLVTGEAEDVLAEVVAAWLGGAERGRFAARHYPDLGRSPIPRFDLIEQRNYLHIGVQLSRGCPYSCEFCNVIELNGRAPRVKSTEQMLAELEALLATGYRGHVDFVDDNLIGDRRSVKPFLAALARWNGAHGRPFEFTTEASLNLADDPELLRLMKDANFFAVFIGIESPDPAALEQTHKKQNLGRDIASSMRKINGAGIFVNAGFIIGFDSETRSVAEAMIACIEQAAIPVCMVGLLFALPGTQLARRLAKEGRLHASSHEAAEDDADQCTSGLNFATLRPRAEILADMREVYRRIYDPAAYFDRVRRSVRALDVRGHAVRVPLASVWRDLRSFFRIAWRSGVRDARVRRQFWATLLDGLLHNPRAIKITVTLAALFLHLGPFARFLGQRLDRQIAALSPSPAAADRDVEAPAVAGAKAVPE